MNSSGFKAEKHALLRVTTFSTFVSENSALGAELRQPIPRLVDWPWSVLNWFSVKQIFRNAARQEHPTDPVLEIVSLRFQCICELGVFEKVRYQGVYGEDGCRS